MECFPLSPDRSEIIEIPYLCEDGYDNGPFLMCPERKGWSWAVPPLFLNCSEGIEGFTPFLQCCLCFGPLSAVLERPLSREELTRDRDDPPRTIMCTEGINEELSLVIQNGRSVEAEIRK